MKSCGWWIFAEDNDDDVEEKEEELKVKEIEEETLTTIIYDIKSNKIAFNASLMKWQRKDIMAYYCAMKA